MCSPLVCRILQHLCSRWINCSWWIASKFLASFRDLIWSTVSLQHIFTSISNYLRKMTTLILPIVQKFKALDEIMSEIPAQHTPCHFHPRVWNSSRIGLFWKDVCKAGIKHLIHHSLHLADRTIWRTRSADLGLHTHRWLSKKHRQCIVPGAKTAFKITVNTRSILLFNRTRRKQMNGHLQVINNQISDNMSTGTQNQLAICLELCKYKCN